jgi:hypothetical protein
MTARSADCPFDFTDGVDQEAFDSGNRCAIARLTALS